MRLAITLTLASTWLMIGCGARAPMSAEMKPMAIQQQAPSKPKVLTQNHFQRDRNHNVSEQGMREILAAPVFLEGESRLGVVPVATLYEPDPELPLATVPRALSDAMEGSGIFEVTTEVSTDWPASRGIGGLRELAARYRSEYLLLYRHRFVEREYTNNWGWTYLTLVAIPFVPSKTMESAGVLEATLFDVKTGTLLFTVFERVHASSDENLWNEERKRRAMKARLLEEATKRLTDQVLAKTGRLAAAREKLALR